MIRLLIAAGIAFSLSALVTQLLIDVLTRSRIGQPIREDGPQGHMVKAGTPTMGGIGIVLGALGGYLLSDLILSLSASRDAIITRSGLLVMGAICAAGFVGFLDDWIKVSRERNLGLNAKLKTAGLLMVAIVFATLTINLTSVSTSLSFARHDLFGIDLTPAGWTLWAVLLIYATSNSVNLTDGLDGLATGCIATAAVAYAVITYAVGRVDWSQYLLVEHVAGIDRIRVGMAAAEVRQGRGVCHRTLRRVESTLQECPGIRSGHRVHGVEAHPKARGEQCPDCIEVEKALHQIGVDRDRIDHFYRHVAHRRRPCSGEVKVVNV